MLAGVANIGSKKFGVASSAYCSVVFLTQKSMAEVPAAGFDNILKGHGTVQSALSCPDGSKPAAILQGRWSSLNVFERYAQYLEELLTDPLQQPAEAPNTPAR